MSKNDFRDVFAEAFDRQEQLDPLAGLEPIFEAAAKSGGDPFEMFLEEDLATDDPRPATVEGYKIVIKQWCEYMSEQGRHPACPNETHAREFIPWLLEGNQTGGAPNSEGTVEMKLKHLSRIYEFWQVEPSLPAEYNEFNPFGLALTKSNLNRPLPPDPPKIEIEDVRKAVHSINHIRDQAMTVLLLKFGMRCGEVVNIKIEDICLEGRDLRDNYPELGTHPELEGYENALYIPPRNDPDLPWEGRDGNKSRRPRIMPLDEELRRTLRKVLLVRPDNPEGWLFLSKRTHTKLEPMYVNDAMKPAFERFNDDPRYRDITSHFGRHYHTTYWRNRGVNTEAIKYMRGDATGEEVDVHDAIAHYIHTYHEDIRDLWLDNIYKLHV